MALTLANYSTSGLTDGSVYFTGTTDATAAAAQNVYLGFTPKEVFVFNITDVLESRYITGMTVAHEIHTLANGTVTDVATNGFTSLTGTEAVPAATLVALGSNGVGGPGIILGSSILIASKSYLIKFIR